MFSIFFRFSIRAATAAFVGSQENSNHSKLSTECQNIEMVRTELLQCDSQFQCGTAYQFVASLLLFPENIKTGCNVNGNVAFLHTIQDFMNAMNLNRNFSGFLVADSVFKHLHAKSWEKFKKLISFAMKTIICTIGALWLFYTVALISRSFHLFLG